ncbi:hypothetical protein QQF64_029845 [Cirrhinus molitorella]|uniref:Uncharacterized protein n=1 Tax=Cirrhinus molitorella TaxID=172907 RepID=A0ABR3N1S6_9TELE
MPRKCCKKHVCKDCEATVNCWLREAERRERKSMQKALAGRKAKIGEMQDILEGSGEANEMLKSLGASEAKIKEIIGGKVIALITNTNPSLSLVSEYVPPPYNHYPMAELQALKVDPDLDCSPPKTPTAPQAAPQAAAQQMPPTAPPDSTQTQRPGPLILHRRRNTEWEVEDQQSGRKRTPMWCLKLP